MSNRYKVSRSSLERLLSKQVPWYLPKRRSREKLQQQLFRRLVQPLSDDWTSAMNAQAETAILDEATPGQRHLLAIFWHDSDIRTGGFYRYFRRDRSRLAFLARDGYFAMGASPYGELLDNAISVLPDPALVEDTERRRRTLLHRDYASRLRGLDPQIESLWSADPLLPYLKGYLSESFADFAH